MCVARTLRYWRGLNTLAWMITIDGLPHQVIRWIVSRCYGFTQHKSVVIICNVVSTSAEGRKFQSSAPAPVALLYRCEIWIPNSDLKRRIDSCSSKCLHRLMGYSRNVYISTHTLPSESQLRYVTCLVREYQLRLCECMACFPELTHAHQVVSARDKPE